MKRRVFLAAATLFSLFGSGPALAAERKKKSSSSSKSSSSGKTSKKSSDSKSSGKSNSKSKSSKSSHGSSRSHSSRSHNNHQEATFEPNSADNPVIDHPPTGTSATRLPPVKAPEPPDFWQTREITTELKLTSSRSTTRLWLPMPLNQDTLYQRTEGNAWEGNFDSGGLRRLPDGDLEVFFCEWRPGVEPRLKLATTVRTADRHFDITRRTMPPEQEYILRRCLEDSQLIPNDGPAQDLGQRIIGRIKDPLAQVKAIYDWVTENAIYDPAQTDGGRGDVRQQIAARDYGGGAADISGLFVSLCRSIGVPARSVYGLRTDRSRMFASLGINDGNATRAQHCRAEFYVPGYSWIPVDPSDVRRAALLEHLDWSDGRFQTLRKLLFGIWEMNWMAYNRGADFKLPGARRITNFLANPQIESTDGSAAPTLVDYRIRTRNIAG